jgi:hypothetical protein
VEYLVQALNWTVVTPSSASMAPTPASGSTVMPETPNEAEDKAEPEDQVEEPEVEERKASYGSFGRYAPYLKEAEGSDAPSAVQTLRMDGCNLRAFVLEALGKLTCPRLGGELMSSNRYPNVRYQEPLPSSESDRTNGRSGTRAHDPRLPRFIDVHVFLLSHRDSKSHHQPPDPRLLNSLIHTSTSSDPRP